MRTIILAGVLLFFTGMAAHGQPQGSVEAFENAELAKSNRDFSLANRLYHQFLAQGKPQDPVIEAKALSGLGYSFFYLSKNDSAIKYIEQAITLKKNLVAANDTFLLKDFAALGYIQRYLKKNPSKAIPLLESERAAIVAHRALVEEQQVFRNAYDLATSYRLVKNFEKALNYGFEALEISLQRNDGENSQTEMCYAVLGNIYNFRNDYKEAETYYSKKIALNLKLHGKESTSLVQDYVNMGNIFLRSGDQARASGYFRLALSFIREHNKARHLLGQIHTSLGASLRDEGRLEAAMTELHMARGLSQDDPTQMAYIFRHMGLWHLHKNQPDSALHYFHGALTTRIDNYTSEDLTDNPETDQLMGDPFLVQIVGLKAKSWLDRYRTTGDREALTHGLDCIRTVDLLYDIYESRLSSENAQLFFKEDNHDLYETALAILYNLYRQSDDPEKYTALAWNFMEKNKATILKANLLRAKSLDNIGLADSLVQKEQTTMTNISRTESDLRSCETKGNCSVEKVATLRVELARLQEMSGDFEQHITELYPKYARGMAEGNLFSIGQLPLGQGQLLVNYFEGEEHLYAIGISDGHEVFERINRTSLFKATVKQFLQQVSGQSLQTGLLAEGFELFQQSGYALYKALLAPFIEPGVTKELIIVPDGTIGMIPFEALIGSDSGSAQTNYAGLDYLIHEYVFCYAHSASLWIESSKKKPGKRKTTLLGFGAALAVPDQHLSKLKGVEEEISSIASLPHAAAFLNQEATEFNFKNSTHEYDIIHLAMHNINDEANPLNSKLVFSAGGAGEDGLLHMYELYGLNINAGLVVLSACQSGIGKFQKGEGSYNIGRGFIYHGNPDMVISLWKVNDYTSARLMSDFYEALQNKRPVNEALRDSKLNYLATADELSAHPSNWAAFVPVGDNFRIKPALFDQKTALFLLAATLLITTWVVRKRKRA